MWVICWCCERKSYIKRQGTCNLINTSHVITISCIPYFLLQYSFDSELSSVKRVLRMMSSWDFVSAPSAAWFNWSKTGSDQPSQKCSFLLTLWRQWHSYTVIHCHYTSHYTSILIVQTRARLRSAPRLCGRDKGILPLEDGHRFAGAPTRRASWGNCG